MRPSGKPIAVLFFEVIPLDMHHQHLADFLTELAGDRETEQQEDVMDYRSAHGFLTGLVVGPVTVDDLTALDYMTAGLTDKASPDARNNALNSIRIIRSEIDRQLNSDEDELEIPADVEANESPMDSPLADWCTGFVEAHFEHEEHWLDTHEQEVAELLLPVMTISGVFSDEPEFREISANADLVIDMCEQLPDILVEMYLLFHSADEKKGGRQ
ncbi:YecA family protein [Kistimonas scapharcae]|uniref:YecA family protein n=2 Tax=Kistimonas scapharcae TaxID=1036133 RepID=A0ABP8V2X8_9GAMM